MTARGVAMAAAAEQSPHLCALPSGGETAPGSTGGLAPSACRGPARELAAGPRAAPRCRAPLTPPRSARAPTRPSALPTLSVVLALFTSGLRARLSDRSLGASYFAVMFTLRLIVKFCLAGHLPPAAIAALEDLMALVSFAAAFFFLHRRFPADTGALLGALVKRARGNAGEELPADAAFEAGVRLPARTLLIGL